MFFGTMLVKSEDCSRWDNLHLLLLSAVDFSTLLAYIKQRMLCMGVLAAPSAENLLPIQANDYEHILQNIGHLAPPQTVQIAPDLCSCSSYHHPRSSRQPAYKQKKQPNLVVTHSLILFETISLSLYSRTKNSQLLLSNFMLGISRCSPVRAWGYCH
jgi:hypothetical protein